MGSKAEKICSGVHTLREQAIELADQVLFMAQKLSDTRKAISKEPLVITYDNGGGQTGIRENPHYVAYEHLLASYTKALRQLTEIVENGAPSAGASEVMQSLHVIANRKIG